MRKWCLQLRHPYIIGRKLEPGVHAQRGQWLLAHVYTVLEQPDLAMQHASRCMEFTEVNPTEMKDFDLAYAL